MMARQATTAALALLLLILPGCGRSALEEQEFGRRYARAWSSQNPVSVAGFFAVDGSLAVNNGTPYAGRSAIAEFARSFMNAFPDMVVSMDSLPTSARGTEFHWTLTGTNTGPDGTGNQVRISGFEIWQFNPDGLIRTSQGSFDVEEYNKQVQYGVGYRDAPKPEGPDMFLGMRTVIYHVIDVDKAKKWYADALGIEPYFDQPFYVGFNVGGFELGLDPDMSGISAGNNVVAYWGVQDVDSALERLLNLGAEKNSDIQEVGGGVRLVTVLDPFGNIFGIIENPHFRIE